eukprot:TRINITY_DN9932_c3_g1_i2.p1 TRINITY_DN9932_c3_g1~~TRINITY_DN9932_c3_g1_i2.p1  ORF type:complete len:214 (+),score=63.32 TRINITY_DN9932_c3_g1_i2:95-736(+)
MQEEEAEGSVGRERADGARALSTTPPRARRAPPPVTFDYSRIEFDELEKGGHRTCWRFLIHPEGWIDNGGIVAVLLGPVLLFKWVWMQDEFPAMFIVGTINIVMMAVCLLIVVPDSRTLGTYGSLRTLPRLLKFDPRMAPNSWRHHLVLALFFYQALVLGAVVFTECTLLANLVLPSASWNVTEESGFLPLVGDRGFLFALASQLSGTWLRCR